VIILYNTSLRGWNDMKNNNNSFIAMTRKILNWVKGLKCSNCKKMEKKKPKPISLIEKLHFATTFGN